MLISVAFGPCIIIENHLNWFLERGKVDRSIGMKDD